MKKYILALALASIGLSSCNDFLTTVPQGEINTDNYYNDPNNAVIGINGIYDLLSITDGQGPDWSWMDHHYDFFYGSMISDDSEKGSKPGDKTDLIDLLSWNFDGSFIDSKAFWIHGFWGVSRANSAILGLNKSSIAKELKTRFLGECYFLRGYYYFYLLRHFGGVPLFSEPVISGGAQRASLHETFEFILKDLDRAEANLPKKSVYSSEDLGRATKAAAQSLKARVLLYQLGIDAQLGDEQSAWKEAYRLTDDVIASQEYSLMEDFGVMFEQESQNTSESIFEIQSKDNGIEAGYAGSTGVGYPNFQGNRAAKDGAFVGWGFNNPTQNLVDAFDPTDPRLSSTVYGIGFNNGILYGKVQNYDRAQQSTNYLNRKAALRTLPTTPKGTQFNIILIRLADVYLMRAEAAYRLGDEAQAKADLNTIRARARQSSLCKGYNEGDVDGYSSPSVEVNLPDVTSGGEALLNAIWHERRLELALENIRTYDLIRQGRFLDTIDKVKDKDREGNTGDEEPQYKGVKESCMKHCLGAEHGAKVPVPVLTIPNTEVTAWGLTQNPH